MVAFYDGDRLFGQDAEALMARKPKQVISNPHRILGRNISHPVVKDYIYNSYLATSVDTNYRGGLDFVLPT